MKSISLTTTALALLALANAFPHMALKMAAQLSKRQSLPSIPTDGGVSYTGAETTVFDAADQYVSNTGDYAYVAPDFDAGDIRGPCPGLNALANHNYIAHNGVTNLLEAIQGTTVGFNMGDDLAGFLSAISVLFDGDLLTQKWSIGGAPSDSDTLDGLLGTPEGLTGSHNKYESDSSPSRGDLYENCNNYEVILDQYQQLYDLHAGEPDDEVSYTFEDLVSFRATRYQQSVENNPYFFYGPFSGLIVSQAAFTFIPAFMSNHSEEYPNGYLSRQVMNSFFAITETGGTGVGDGTLSYNQGTERFPDNWYRRSSTVPYSIPLFIADLVRLFTTEPSTFDIGGNTDGVNTFSGISFGDISGGLYDSSSLLDETNLQCFSFQLLQQLVLDQATTLDTALLDAVNTLVGDYISPATDGLGCPTLASIQPTEFTSGYPGANYTSACI